MVSAPLWIAFQSHFLAITHMVNNEHICERNVVLVKDVSWSKYLPHKSRNSMLAKNVAVL